MDNFPYLGNSNPNWRTHIFQRGGSTTNQLICLLVWLALFWRRHFLLFKVPFFPVKPQFVAESPIKLDAHQTQKSAPRDRGKLCLPTLLRVGVLVVLDGQEVILDPPDISWDIEWKNLGEIQPRIWEYIIYMYVIYINIHIYIWYGTYGDIMDISTVIVGDITSKLGITWDMSLTWYGIYDQLTMGYSIGEWYTLW